MSFGRRVRFYLHHGAVSTSLSRFFQTWPCQCVRLSCFPGPDLGQLWLVFARGPIPIQVRRAVSADPDAQGRRKRLRADGLLLTTAVFDRVP